MVNVSPSIKISKGVFRAHPLLHEELIALCESWKDLDNVNVYKPGFKLGAFITKLNSNEVPYLLLKD